ncbi:ankyrin [Coniochaeta sp. PMI_546]|nr:ankyrin [Coniochaeta sp. PMI_546]
MVPLYVLTGQSSPIFTLPLEILIQICHFISPSDQNNLSRSCKYLTLALQKDLFERCSGSKHHEAILYGCTQPNAFVIRRALHYGCPLNVDDEIFNGGSALALASYSGHPLAVLYLLQKHAKVNKEGSDGLTPLAHALNGISTAITTDDRMSPHAQTILRLLRAGANPKCKLPADLLGDEGLGNAITVVVDAAVEERLPPAHAKCLIEKLVHQGADPNGLGCSYVTPLQLAVRHFEVFGKDGFDLLLKKGADVDFGAEFGIEHTALGEAILEDNIVAMRHLLSYGANIGPAADAPSGAPLWCAAYEENIGSVLTLLQHGADPNIIEEAEHSPGYYVSTCLSTAVSLMHISKTSDPIVRLLLEHGADPNLHDVTDRSSLYYALCVASAHRACITELLLKSNADPNAPEQGGASTPLICAIQAHNLPPEGYEHLEPTTSRERLEVVEKLLQAGADVNQRANQIGYKLSPLEAALTTPYPPKDRMASAEEGQCLFVRGPASDFYILSMLFAIGTAQQGVPINHPCVIQDLPELPWEDELIPTLLRAGATVTQKTLDLVRQVLKCRYPCHFLG